MFDIGVQELLVIVVVAVLVIGPKDMPLALRSAGRWVGKIRKVSAHFRSGIDAMIREAELEEMEKKWQAQNQKVMEAHPGQEMTAQNAAGEDIPEPDGPAPAAAEAKTDGPAVQPDEPKKD
jgi:sec-independent protein translocase protein TatB